MSKRVARGVTTLAVASGAAFAAPPSVAHAGADAAVEGGAFFGYAFGAPRGFHWGFELRTRIYSDAVDETCGPAAPYTSGVVSARLGATRNHFFVQMLGGVTHQADFLSVGAQLGIGYQHGAPQALRIPLLLDGRAYVAVLYAELDLRTGRSGSVDLGTFLPPVGGFGRHTCAIGRPMRDGQGERLSAMSAFDSRPQGGSPRADEAALWSRTAIMEAESVPAFDVLAHDLVRAGAPQTLAERAVSAGDDEVLHAHLAAALSGDVPTVAPMARTHDLLTSRAALGGDELLARLAVESWLDGCLGEGAAAERARRESERLRDDDARRAQRIIATDERRHADLAWDVLAWTVQAGGTPVRRALHEALGVELSITSDVDAGEATSLGYLDRDDVARVHRCVREAALHRVRCL